MYPYVSSDDVCTYGPVRREEEVNVGDIVFCEVNSRDGRRLSCYARLVLDKERDNFGKMCYIIGNASRHENGWCHIEHIYGRLVSIDRYLYR